METPDVNTIVETYAAAWNAADHERRRQLLEQVWSDDGVYEDPRGRAVGRQALSEHIHAFRRRFPQLRLELTGEPAHHHGHLCFTWRALDTENRVSLAGRDFGELGRDGRLQSVVGFFGT